jgi:hypothetical protein
MLFIERRQYHRYGGIDGSTAGLFHEDPLSSCSY